MNSSIFWRLPHSLSDSLAFIELSKVKGKIVISDFRFVKGNVVSLVDVRRGIETAKKELSGSQSV